MTIVIRKAEQSDHSQILSVLGRAFADYVKLLGREQSSNDFHHLGAAIDDGLVYVAIVDGQITGAICASRNEDGLLIDELGVDPDHYRKGIGGRLLEEFEYRARENGFQFLLLITAEKIVHLVRFYHQHGFRIIDRQPPAHGKDPYMRVHMRKALISG